MLYFTFTVCLFVCFTHLKSSIPIFCFRGKHRLNQQDSKFQFHCDFKAAPGKLVQVGGPSEHQAWGNYLNAVDHDIQKSSPMRLVEEVSSLLCPAGTEEVKRFS